MVTLSSILAWKFPGQKSSPWGHKESGTTGHANTHTSVHVSKKKYKCWNFFLVMAYRHT